MDSSSSSGETRLSASWGSSGLAAFNSNGKGEYAKLVIDATLKDQEFRAAMIAEGGWLSVHNDIAIDYGDEAMNEIMAYGISYGAVYADSTFGILQPYWTDCRGVFYPLKQDLFTGNITPEEFVDKWHESVQGIIDAYYAA